MVLFSFKHYWFVIMLVSFLIKIHSTLLISKIFQYSFFSLNNWFLLKSSIYFFIDIKILNIKKFLILFLEYLYDLWDSLWKWNAPWFMNGNRAYFWNFRFLFLKDLFLFLNILLFLHHFFLSNLVAKHFVVFFVVFENEWWKESWCGIEEE